MRLGQVAHVDLERDWAPFRLGEGLNALLHPHPVAVLGAERVSDDFDARHSASARHYLYRIVNRRAPLTFERGRAWRVKPRLDAAAMHAAARVLIGRHDFSTFRDSQCQAKSPIRTLDRLDVRRDGDEILFEASARSFLHRQVRSMVGSLVEVGTGRWSARRFQGGVQGRRPQPLRSGGARARPLSRPGGLFRSGRAEYPRPRMRGRIRSPPPTARRTQRNKAPARAHRCATAPRDRRARPARRRRGWSR